MDIVFSDVPYEFDYDREYSLDDTGEILARIQALADQYKHYPNRVKLLHRFKSLANVTCLDKVNN
jgi:hypothetical protein